MLYYLAYLSSAQGLYTEDTLEEILSISRKNNTADDITGMLLYIEGNIIQVLEGEQEKVRRTYDRISQDSRHRGVLKLAEGPIETRSFPDWSMGFKVLPLSEISKMDGYKTLNDTSFLFPEEEKDKRSNALLLLQSFYRGMNRYAVD